MEHTEANQPNSLSGDMLHGIKAISDFIGWPERTTYHAAASGTLPGVFQLGRKWCALKSEIRSGLQARARGKAA
ncbi:hypothetical protein [Rhodoblastus sp.]|uniref:hypothetical protein n=1 Tax=Rhodoblastus sp. TaxID=1962975 RepID=UPI003F9D8E7B